MVLKTEHFLAAPHAQHAWIKILIEKAVHLRFFEPLAHVTFAPSLAWFKHANLPIYSEVHHGVHHVKRDK